ncbi:hypothetical protein BGW41_007614 [Actinomortierella wolfii]|nr:hypothetical protein BGW41_007614 [Actinomortierella wolfii]
MSRMDMTLLTKRLINLRRLESVCSTERLMGLFHTESASPSPSPSPPSKRSSASETTEQQDCNQPYERTSNDTSDNSQKTLHPTPPSSLSSSPSSTTLLPPVILRPKDGKTRDCQLWSLELQNTLANLSFTDCVQPYMDVAHVHRLSCGRVPEDQMQVGDDDDDYGEEEEDGDEDERDGKFSFSLSANLKSNKPPPWVSPSIPKRRTHVDEEHEHILTLDWLNRLQRLPPSLLELYPGLKREVQKLAHQV